MHSLKKYNLKKTFLLALTGSVIVIIFLLFVSDSALIAVLSLLMVGTTIFLFGYLDGATKIIKAIPVPILVSPIPPLLIFYFILKLFNLKKDMRNNEANPFHLVDHICITIINWMGLVFGPVFFLGGIFGFMYFLINFIS